MSTGTGWRDIPIGGLIVEAGNSVNYKTGGWRAFRPLRDVEQCTQCLMCWLYCPDSSILVEGGQVVGFDLEHCKGCGVCASVCPKKVEVHALTKQAGKVIQLVEEGSELCRS